ncbi:hypothetical protein [Paenibacillus sp. FSL H3-0333]|uniref:hypothetical protein n=1 Tax=Paenibacillus sp. FSL H3-0333 TaxID=2921373 RepID=UPI0030F946F3
MNKSSLDTLEIEIILNALDFSKEKLLKVYSENWLEKKLAEIKHKLDTQQVAVENENIIREQGE